MSLLPWAYGAVSPFNVFGADPWSSWDVTPYPRSISSMTPSLRRMERDLGRLISSVKEDDKSFQMSVDVGEFRPNEITVKTTDDSIIVHGKHQERSDRHGYVSREFRRRVTIPKGVNPEQVTSSLSPDGVLTIMAPKLSLEGSNERVIPITMTQTSGAAVGAAPSQPEQK